MAQVSIGTILHVQDFGLERIDEDRAIVGFAQEAGAGHTSVVTLTNTLTLLEL
jgi:hypothetical protein